MADRPAQELPPNLIVGDVDPMRIAENLMHFVRMLRALGFKAGPGAPVECARALALIGVGRRVDFYWALHALLVEREEQRPLFSQAFRLFWRHVDPFAEDLSLLAPPDGMRSPDSQKPVSRRVGEAWGEQDARPRRDPTELEVDRAGTASAAETLKRKDFEQMSQEEWEEARRLVPELLKNLRPRRTRRFRPAPAGELDVKATVRGALRGGGELLALERKARRLRPPPLVAICDISGSMSRYSRMFLHFMHGMGRDGSRAHRFVFGTRLTCIDRSLRSADPDAAMERVGEAVRDWSGGTRIAEALHEFNRSWARRTLSQGAVVLLATDGLERGGPEEVERLAFEADRLAKSCSRLVWLNPLLRWDRWEALAGGARAISRAASEVRTIHDISSLADLGRALAGERRLARGDAGR